MLDRSIITTIPKIYRGGVVRRITSVETALEHNSYLSTVNANTIESDLDLIVLANRILEARDNV